MKKILFFIIFCLISSFAYATDYYADGTLSADCTAGDYSIASRNCSGSDGNAYDLIQEAADQGTNPGDAIYIRAGTYYEQVSFGKYSGTSGAYIELRNYASETVIIDAQNTRQYGILFGTSSTNSYNRVKNVTVRNATRAGIRISSTHSYVDIDNVTAHDSEKFGIYGVGDVSNITVQNCTTYNNGTGNVAAYGIHFEKSGGSTHSSNIIIDNNTSYNNGGGILVMKDFAGGGGWTVDSDGEYESITMTDNTVYNNTGQGVKIAKTLRFYIDGNTVYDNGYTCFQLEHGVRWGVVSNNTCYGNNTGSSGEAGLWADGTQYVVFDGNIVYDNHIGSIIGQSQYIIVRNNLFYDNDLDFNIPMGILLAHGQNCDGDSADYDPPDTCGASNNMIVHNTFYNQGAAGHPYGGITATLGSSVPTNSNIVKNNIVAESAGDVEFTDKEADDFDVVDYNILYNSGRSLNFYRNTTQYNFTNWKSTTGYEANSINDNPDFTDAVNDDYTLTAGSPAVDAADDLTLASGAGASSTSLTVDDARYFHDGYGAPTAVGDTVIIGTAEPVVISDVNYSTNVITLSEARTWSDNDTVNYYTEDADPDIGYAEYSGGGGDTTPPSMCTDNQYVTSGTCTGGGGTWTDDLAAAQGSGAGEIDLTWTRWYDESQGYPATYKIRRCLGVACSPSSVTYTKTSAEVACSADSACAFTDTGLTNNTQYCYDMYAVDSAGNPSSPSLFATDSCATTQSVAQTYTVKRAACVPGIDGIKDVGAWTNANSDTITAQTFYFLCDSDYLYGFIESTDTKLEAIYPYEDDPNWNDDGIQFLISPDGSNYYDFSFNLFEAKRDYSSASGINWDLSGMDIKVDYDGTLNNATADSTYYNIEFKIPWTGLMTAPTGCTGGGDENFSADLIENDRDDGALTQTCWNNDDGGSCTDISGYGTFTFTATQATCGTPTETIVTICASGCDYTTLQAALNAKAADITDATGSDLAYIFRMTDNSTETGLIDVDGATWVTDADNDIIIECYGDGRHNGVVGSGYVFDPSVAGSAVYIDTQYVTFRYCEITDFTGTANGDSAIRIEVANVTIVGNIVHDYTDATYNINGIATNGSTLTAYHNLVYNGDNIGIGVGNGGATGTIYNNTIINHNIGLFCGTSGTITDKNNISIDNTTDYSYDGTCTNTSDWNIASDTTAEGANSLDSQDPVFRNEAGNDYDLKVPYWGTDLSLENDLKDRSVRSTPALGALEYYRRMF